LLKFRLDRYRRARINEQIDQLSKFSLQSDIGDSICARVYRETEWEGREPDARDIASDDRPAGRYHTPDLNGGPVSSDEGTCRLRQPGVDRDAGRPEPRQLYDRRRSLASAMRLRVPIRLHRARGVPVR